jgi:PEP-CTERM motif
MKKLTTAAILVGGAIMASQSIFAQNFVSDDLYLGLANPNGGGSADYIINLGDASSIVGGSSIIPLNSYISGFPSELTGTDSSTIEAGVVGGNQYIPNIYYTQLRTSSFGVPSVAGSTTPDSIDGIEGAISALNALNAPNAGSGVTDTSESWENHVADPLVNNSFQANAHNPDALVNIGGILYEDLYFQNQDSTTPVYEGYFTLDLTGGTSSPSLSFTPEAVPEPATSALIGGGSLLLLAFRRRLSIKNA